MSYPSPEPRTRAEAGAWEAKQAQALAGRGHQGSPPSPAPTGGARTSGVVAGQPVHLEDEVILEEEEAHDGEEVDKDEGQQGGQQDGAAVAGHALDDVEQRLLPVNEVEELQGRDGP